MVDNIEYTINHGLSYETANYLQNMGDGRVMPVPVRAIALDFPRFAIMHDHAATGDRIEYNGLEYQIVGPVRRYLGWGIFQVKQVMARGAAWVPNFTPGAPRARDIVQRMGGVVLLDAPGNSIGPGVTFSRADQAMVCDEAGNWTWTALPYRRSYDVATKEWGYLFEPQRTNLAIWSKPNGTSNGGGSARTNWNADSTQLDVGKITLLSGGTFYPRLKPVLESGKTYTFSATVWSANPIPNVKLTSFQDGGVGWMFGPNEAVTEEKRRITWTFTTTSQHSSQGSGFRLAGDAGTFIELENFQIEEGPIATSPIATDGAAKTVAADVCTHPTSGIAEVLMKVNGVATCAPATSVSIPPGSRVQFLATFPTQLDAATRQLMLSVVQ